MSYTGPKFGWRARAYLRLAGRCYRCETTGCCVLCPVGHLGKLTIGGYQRDVKRWQQPRPEAEG